MSIILNVINYFWKLGYNEEAPELFVKKYCGSYPIKIDMLNEVINYGDRIKVFDESLVQFSQINFVILESIDRFLTNGYEPQNIKLSKSELYDYLIEDYSGSLLAIKCSIWEDEYDDEVKTVDSKNKMLSSFFEENTGSKFVLYTSRLKAGLIENRYTIVENKSSKYTDLSLEDFNKIQNYGLFGEHKNSDSKTQSNFVNKIQNETFVIDKNKFVRYEGESAEITIPEGIGQIMNGAFWNCTHLEKLNVPDSVTSLGGDTFFDCINLEDFTIPSSVKIIGDNPFANCPNLSLINKSPNFVIEDGALYDKDKTRLIYCSINRKSEEFVIPNGVISIGKHAFYNCQNLKRIVIPESVRIIENNPFTNCPLLQIENNSPYFVLDDGALYNKTMTTLSYYQVSDKSESYIIPDGVNIIGRHSFYNCHYLKSLTIPDSVKIIGYNPFTNCPYLSLINHSSNYLYENGALYNKDKTELIYYSLSNDSNRFSIPDTIKKIGRNAFFGSDKLTEIIIPDGVEAIERSAFANCTKLSKINIPETVLSIGEWAFYNCQSLLEINIPKHASTEGHTFEKCLDDLKIVREIKY